MRAVRRADFAQTDTGALDDLGKPEGAADLDQLAARHDDLAILRQGVEHDHQGGGIVVDDSGVLRAGQLAHKLADEVVALAAAPVLKIELERDRAAHRDDGGRDGDFCKDCAAKIGVQHRAGEVVDRPHLRRSVVVQLRDDGRREILARDRRLRAVSKQGARRVDRAACRRDGRRTSEAFGRGDARFGAEHFIDRGQLLQESLVAHPRALQ